MYENRASGNRFGIDGTPGRLTFLQAQNAMNTFAKESGGAHFPMTFAGEIPTLCNSINALFEINTASLTTRAKSANDGKKYKLEVKVDVNGDGIYEEKQFVVQHRPFYTTPKDKSKK